MVYYSYSKMKHKRELNIMFPTPPFKVEVEKSNSESYLAWHTWHIHVQDQWEKGFKLISMMLFRMEKKMGMEKW